MIYDPQILDLFRSVVLQNLIDTEQQTINNIESHTEFKYGDDFQRLKALKKIGKDYITGHFNHLNAKGVDYSTGTVQIVESEFMELINEWKPNLKTYCSQTPIFDNELDLKKAPAYKSHFQIISIMAYCLQVQILNDYRENLKDVTSPKTILKNNRDKNKYQHLFKDNGFEKFKYLREKFHETSPTTKYTLIHDVLRSLLTCNDSEYMNFVRSYCSEDFGSIKFARMANNGSEKYTQQLEKITKLYSEIK